MKLWPYQEEAVNACLESWQKFDDILGVAATGAGKTVIASQVFKDRQHLGNGLFLAHREELLDQAIDKLWTITKQKIGLEKGFNRASYSDKIVVASVQSLHKARLEKWPQDHFATVIVDECHRAAAKTYQNVIHHFGNAKMLGITATPDRSDQKSLATVFEHIAFEIGLVQLIKDGYLAPIRVEQIPLKIDLEGVKLDSHGDLDVTETAHRLEPYLDALANELLRYRGRKTLVFLPLIRLSQQFVEAAKAAGLAAEHIDGESVDRKEILQRFHKGETMLLSCATLLSEGYDEPSVDCVVMMRPTQSRTLYCQCLGRGFRICENKTDLLVLDPLWLSSQHSLIKPANLIAKDETEAEKITKLLAEEPDLLAAQAKNDRMNLALVQERARALAQVLDATSKRERQTYDPLEVAAVLQVPELADYVPIVGWQSQQVTIKQSELLVRLGINPAAINCKGQASAIIDRLMARNRQQLATFRQLRYLVKFGYPDPQHATREQASIFLSQRWGNGRPRQTTFA